MQEMVQLPQHLRTRYYFEQSLEVKIQTYFGINDPEKLKRVSRSDPFKVGDEVIVANYASKFVTKHDISKPKKRDDKPTVPEAGKSQEETDSSNINSGNGEVSAPEFEDGSDGDGREPEFEDSSDGDGSEPDTPVVQPQAVGRGRCDVAESFIPVIWPEAVGGGRQDVAEPDAPVVQYRLLAEVGMMQLNPDLMYQMKLHQRLLVEVGMM